MHFKDKTHVFKGLFYLLSEWEFVVYFLWGRRVVPLLGM